MQYIETSPHRKGSAYYAVYRYLLGDFEPYIYKTDDYGATWKRLTDGKNGIPTDWPTRVVREDPDREGLLYAGTEFGMFISFDNGAHWQHFDLNMPTVPITDIKRPSQRSDRRDAGSVDLDHGRRHAAAQLDAADRVDRRAALQAARRDSRAARRRARRVRWRRRRRAQSGQPQFPPYGATINYYLGRAPSGPVTIEILDAAGKIDSHVLERSAGARPRRRRAGRRAGRRREGRRWPPGGAAGSSDDERRHESAHLGLQQRRRAHGAAGHVQGEDDARSRGATRSRSR